MVLKVLTHGRIRTYLLRLRGALIVYATWPDRRILVLESEIVQSGCIFVSLWEADENFFFVFDEFNHDSHVEFFGVAEVAFGDGVFDGVLSHESIMAEFW